MQEYIQYIYYNAEWVEARKMSEDFWAKLYYKMSQLIC